MLIQLLLRSIAFVLVLCTVLLGSPPAWANPVQTDHVQVQLVSEVESVQPDRPFWVGLHFQIRDGWHTYWQNPGDSGAAPTIAWTLPPGFEAGALAFPYPSRLPAGPLMNFGYENEVTLLSQITPPANLAASGSVQLQAEADWLVCEIDCIPESATFSIDLPVTPEVPAPNSSAASLFTQARQGMPRSSPWPVSVQSQDETLILQVDAPELQAGRVEQASFFPNQDGVITNAATQDLSLQNNALTLQIQRGYLSDLEQVSGVLVIQEALENQTIAQAFTIEAAVGTNSSQAAAALPLWQTMLLALLGGAMLNLMPCVFPVLSLKALNIVQQAQKSPQQVRRSAIVFTAGVLLSFLVVAGGLLVLRGLGQQVGWGFQLQSPVFVTLMAYLMFAVGLSLSGVFLFGASLMGMGQGLAARTGYVGEFFTGVFATVVATPCTAPFMATAIGVALTQPPWIAILIFQFLGLGLALPYLAISLIPALHKRLPRPGAWMETFQQALAFPMYAATAWLVWVLTQQAGAQGLAIGLAGLILIAFAAWLHQKTRLSSIRWQRVGTILALVVLGFALTLAQIPRPLPTQTAPAATAALLDWQPYAADRLSQLRQSGTPVFVNFSAAWCITCLVNEQVALNQPETAAAFASKDVALLKGDWTNRDQAITKTLESFGRSGVPLYVLYPSGATTQPIVLPQILSPSEIQTAIEQI